MLSLDKLSLAITCRLIAKISITIHSLGSQAPVFVGLVSEYHPVYTDWLLITNTQGILNLSDTLWFVQCSLFPLMTQCKCVIMLYMSVLKTMYYVHV